MELLPRMSAPVRPGKGPFFPVFPMLDILRTFLVDIVLAIPLSNALGQPLVFVLVFARLFGRVWHREKSNALERFRLIHLNMTLHTDGCSLFRVA